MLPEPFYLIVGALLALTLLFTGLALRALFKGHLIHTALHGLLSTLVIALLMIVGLIIANLYTFQRLSSEQAVAEIRFKSLGEQRYHAFFYQIKANKTTPYLLFGDEWQLDTRVIKWKGLPLLLGLDNLYRLERLSGRYQASADEINQPRSVFALQKESPLDFTRLAKRHQKYIPWVDSYYGNASYMPMSEGAHYIISLTNSGGLIARPANPITEKLVENWN